MLHDTTTEKRMHFTLVVRRKVGNELNSNIHFFDPTPSYSKTSHKITKKKFNGYRRVVLKKKKNSKAIPRMSKQ